MPALLKSFRFLVGYTCSTSGHFLRKRDWQYGMKYADKCPLPTLYDVQHRVWPSKISISPVDPTNAAASRESETPCVGPLPKKTERDGEKKAGCVIGGGCGCIGDGGDGSSPFRFILYFMF